MIDLLVLHEFGECAMRVRARYVAILFMLYLVLSILFSQKRCSPLLRWEVYFLCLFARNPCRTILVVLLPVWPFIRI